MIPKEGNTRKMNGSERGLGEGEGNSLGEGGRVVGGEAGDR
jgi:hypothetical protein